MDFTFLGQTGFHFRHEGGRGFLIDPYLSDSVAERFGEDLRRRFPSPYGTGEPQGIDFVLLTHAHADHTDPASLMQVVDANPDALIIGPESIRTELASHEELISRFRPLGCDPVPLGNGVIAVAVPAAHTDLVRDGGGFPECVGYVIRSGNSLLYHAGDTIPHEEIVSAVRAIGVPDIALLPCNERNHYRDGAGIIGNMTIREMLQFAGELGAKKILATHWDMFAPNSAFPAEIELIHALTGCPIPLIIPDHHTWHSLPSEPQTLP